MLTRKQYNTWPDNAFPNCFHHSVDPSKDWVPSPLTQPLAVSPEGGPIGEGFTASQEESDGPLRDRGQIGSDVKNADLSQRKASRLSLRYWRDLLRSRKRRAEAEEVPDSAAPTAHEPAEQRRATTADWRAYGHWARPTFYQMVLHNATPPTVPRALDNTQIKAIFHNLLDYDGNRYPERWIPGVEYPSLPPRPALWPPLSPHSVFPPASELQLNPLLAHRPFGAPAVQWDLRMVDADSMPHVNLGDAPPPFDSDDTLSIPIPLELRGPNGAQPATYPGVRSLSITVLADDPLPVFPWPFIVNSHHETLPVTICDVMCAIKDNFEEHMTQEEVDSLTLPRKDIVFDAYRARTVSLWKSVEDGVRRVDYLGPNYMFRGLEPTPDGEGFMIFVGPP